MRCGSFRPYLAAISGREKKKRVFFLYVKTFSQAGLAKDKHVRDSITFPDLLPIQSRNSILRAIEFLRRDAVVKKHAHATRKENRVQRTRTVAVSFVVVLITNWSADK